MTVLNQFVSEENFGNAIPVFRTFSKNLIYYSFTGAAALEELQETF